MERGVHPTLALPLLGADSHPSAAMPAAGSGLLKCLWNGHGASPAPVQRSILPVPHWQGPAASARARV